jgi:phosphoribosylformimino-5-aminoimidazole carboxamide ribotide isomerase
VGANLGFEILPAIDLRGGRVVRLVEGDFERETDYGDDPVGVARSFASAGARTLHVVDLDGARDGSPMQLQAVAAIAAAGVARIEVAGGLRFAADVAAAFAVGADRVVVGTRAIEDPSFAAELVARHGATNIVVALDVRDGAAVGHGWRHGAPGVVAEDALRALADAGVGIFEVTAISRDGRLEGPDLVLLRRLVELGGGAIVGRALYEGRLDLAEAVAVLA